MDNDLIKTSMKLTKESETLFIPLLGKAEVSLYGDILQDEKAKEIVESVGYPFKKMSKFLSIYMGIRAAILDRYVENFIKRHPQGMVIYLGCGLDSRVERVKAKPFLWIDLDLPDVIQVRKQFYQESGSYRMIGKSVTDFSWLEEAAECDRPVIVVAEGLTMYLTDEENKELIQQIRQHFARADYVFDAYSISAVWWSKYKNPVNKMGAVIRWGLDEPLLLEDKEAGIQYIETKYFTHQEWVGKLSGRTKWMFKFLYGNKWADNLYRIYYYKMR